uniref:AAA+ ATPase domain-containing protein n=1 Tax=Lygus hesperus TaxID=30085 RepID=A0A0A9WYK0_LYGHE
MNDEDFIPTTTDDVSSMPTSDIQALTKMLDAEVRIMKSERNRLHQEMLSQNLRCKENKDKIKVNKVRPYLVSNIVEVLNVPNDEDDTSTETTGANTETGQTVVVKTTMRQVLYLPVPGLVDVDFLKPGDLVGVNKDSFLILERLPVEYDPRIRAMEVDEKPTDTYTDIGGLDKQIQELMEAVVLPMTQKDRFTKLGIVPPKGVILFGPPGTGKTLLARACAAQTNSTFLKLAGPQLVQMFIGDGAKLVRDAFALAKEKAPTIIFIDEIDAIGTKRSTRTRREIGKCRERCWSC